MGGSSYDRDVYSGSSSSSWGTSSASTKKLSSRSLDSSMDPTGKILKSNSKYPIVIMLDVTGSNIDFAKLVYDKLPMFHGQIEEKGYLDDFDISVCAIGDATCDEYPLQVADFAKGIELDSWMEKLVLEAGGGPGLTESYELGAYYLSQQLKFKKGAKPVVFFIADEYPYPEVKRSEADKFEIPFAQTTDGFSNLRTKVKDNVFVFLNPYRGSFEKEIVSTWTKLLAPQHVIKIPEEKAIIDLMLGVIATLAKKTLKTYALDMKGRGQTPARIKGVTKALEGLEVALVPAERFKTELPVKTGTKTSKRGKRI